jgi:hypothetical protein
MSALAPQSGEILKVTIVKNHVNDVSDKFVTGYEFETLVQDLGPLNVESLVNAVVGFEVGMTRDSIQFDRAVVSTWVEEPGGYDPSQFVTFALSDTGSAAGSTSDLPLEACLLVRREVNSGRQGRLFLRGYLNESDVQSVAGVWKLTDPTEAQDSLDAAVSTGLASYIGAAATEFAMVLHGPNKAGTLYTRRVEGLVAAGVTWASRSRKHYNRGS